MEQKEIEILKKLKFRKPTLNQFYNLDEYLQIRPEYYYSTLFSVKGDHSYDAVEIYYVENEKVKGLYYSSSLIDELYSLGFEKEIKNSFNEIKNYFNMNNSIHGEFLLEEKNNIIWFIIKCDLDNAWKVEKNLASLMKASILLDFFAQKLEEEYNKKLNAED